MIGVPCRDDVALLDWDPNPEVTPGPDSPYIVLGRPAARRAPFWRVWNRRPDEYAYRGVSSGKTFTQAFENMVIVYMCRALVEVCISHDGVVIPRARYQELLPADYLETLA